MIQRKPMEPEQALARAEELCARSEQSAGEVADKLRRWGLGAEATEKIIKLLKQNRYIDDSRFAKAYVYDKVSFARWGRMKIARGLMQKRVARETAEEALDSIDMETYTRNLTDLIRQKLRTDPALAETFEGRTKIYRFLLQRGYESRLASEYLKKALTPS